MMQVRLLVEAVVDLMARYLPEMRSRGAGAIINMPSTAAFQALPYNAGYSAAKSHVLLMSEAVHAEVADQGVTVTAVCPGPVPSCLQDASDADYFAEKLPKFTFVEPERVARDALRAAARGQISVIPRRTPRVRRLRPQSKASAVAGSADQQASDGAPVDSRAPSVDSALTTAASSAGDDVTKLP